MSNNEDDFIWDDEDLVEPEDFFDEEELEDLEDIDWEDEEDEDE